MSLLTLDIEKPTAGGRMLARHEGQVVLVAGAIPGERVIARVVRSERRVLFADTVEVVTPSVDRRAVDWDVRCGGSLLAHIDYRRQLRLKGEIIEDAFRRIGHIPVRVTEMLQSPEQGYRMRARLHAQGNRLGFYLEGTHTVCEAASTGQLLPSTAGWIGRAASVLAAKRLSGVAAVEIVENCGGDSRACHLELDAGVDPRPFAALADGLVGLSARSGDRQSVDLAGTPAVTDSIHPTESSTLSLRRSARSFFQGNRFLLEPLVRQVIGLVPEGPTLDLYAGVGLFGLSLAAARNDAVMLVEGDPVSGNDLERNAAPFGGWARVARSSVEAFLAALHETFEPTTVIVDPPRTGLSKEVTSRLARLAPLRIVYVSCDVATLARDARLFVDGGYHLERVSGVDLFPNTAHVESIAVFDRSS